MNDDIFYMKKAIRLAKKAEGYTNPNPMVGAIIVKNNKIIGSGYHKAYGFEHAEINAFNNCNNNCDGATLYVTLEPCCHFGKTPPCINKIIENKIKRVVFGSFDPNPIVSKKSLKILQQNNIDVTYGILKNECDELIKKFKFFIENKKPYITLKYAMTLDGKIATKTNKSKWISNEKALIHNRKDRYKHTAIMVGVNTVLIDDPLLTTRIKNKRNPIRIICDSKLKTPLNSNIVNTAKDIRTIIATTITDKNLIEKYTKKNCEILIIKQNQNYLDLNDLVYQLGRINIDDIVFEGAKTLAAKFLEYKLINYIKVYVCPKIFGGDLAISPIGGIGIDNPNDAITIKNQKVVNIDNDILIEGEVVY